MTNNNNDRLTLVRGGQGRTSSQVEASATIVGFALATPIVALIIVGAIYALRWVLT